jgi:hypothetical protein
VSRTAWYTVGFVGLGLFALLLIPLLWVGATPPKALICGYVDKGLIVTAPDPRVAPDGRLDPEQTMMAAVIVSEVVRRGLPPRAAVIALATAMAESGLHNIPMEQSDRDSSGIFQQRLMFYGHINPMDPLQATGAFLDELTSIPDWETRPVGEVAQAVQSSGVPEAYEPRVPAAEGVAQALWGDAGAVVPCGPGVVLAGTYTLPVPPAIYDTYPNWFAQPHHDYPALDIPVPEGTPVYAVTGGQVIASPVGGSCGNGVSIAGDDGVIYTYCHGAAALAPPGGRVEVGDLIMVSGFTGAVDPPGSAGAHLHLQMRLGAGGPYLCPQRAMEAWSHGDPLSSVELPSTGCSY